MRKFFGMVTGKNPKVSPVPTRKIPKVIWMVWEKNPKVFWDVRGKIRKFSWMAGKNPKVFGVCSGENSESFFGWLGDKSDKLVVDRLIQSHQVFHIPGRPHGSGFAKLPIFVETYVRRCRRTIIKGVLLFCISIRKLARTRARIENVTNQTVVT